MYRKTENISLYLIWIVILMFFAHGAVPHDHHSGYHSEHKKQSSQNQSTPVHCHVLNDLIIDRTADSISTLSFSKTSPNSFIRQLYNLPDQHKTLMVIIKTSNDLFPDDTHRLNNAPVRGSPFII